MHVTAPRDFINVPDFSLKIGGLYARLFLELNEEPAMRKKSMFSTVLGVLVLVVLGVGGYTFFKDLEGPIIEVSPNTGRVSPASMLKINMQDVSGLSLIHICINTTRNYIIINRWNISINFF